MDGQIDTATQPPRQVKPHFAPRTHNGFSSSEIRSSDHFASHFARDLLSDAMEARATDIHFEPEREYICVRFRIDGVLHDIMLLPLDPGAQILGHFKALARIDPTPLAHPADGRCEFGMDGSSLNLRVSCVPCIVGEMMAIRLLDTRNLQLALTALGLSEDHLATVELWLKRISGMFLVVGPTGSGKTTTLYALLHELKLSEQSIITIEDPVEYNIPGVNQLQINSRRGFTFEEAVGSMLRLDPDFLLVGEIRDKESAHSAIEAAASGKTLLSTLHSRDAAGAISALRNLGLKDFQTSSALQVVVAQRLARRLCRDCRRKEKPDEAERDQIQALGFDVPDSIWKAGKCDRCGFTGFLGRTGIFEVWHIDAEASRLILNHSDEHRLRKAIRDSGVRSLMRDAWDKFCQGVISLDQIPHAPD